MSTKTILVIDDSDSVRAMVKDYLSAQGFRVVTADDGKSGLETAQREKPDVILLDIMMPGMDGYEFIRLYRKERETPIILLTARIEESDKVVGLELGADDYLTKPFGMRELLARIRVLLRRSGQSATHPVVLRAGDLTLDEECRQVAVKDHPVNLTPSEFSLLSAFMSQPGRVFTRMDLLDHLDGVPFEGSERSIDVHIRNLRAKLEAEGAPYYIETVFGVGYRFNSNPG
jgi:DNA-binding response OmpR family regulator